MTELLQSVKQNLTFILICVLIVAALMSLAVIFEKLCKRDKRSLSAAKRISFVAVFGALAAVFMLIEIPLFFAPSFYKLDFSELPVLICGFYLGPFAGVCCELVKVVVELLLRGTATAFVGEFANFAVGCSFVLPATALYYKLPSKKGALIALCVGALTMTVFGSAFNAWYLLPKFAELYGIPLGKIIEMGTKINPKIVSVQSLVLFAVVPFNLLKGVLVSALTFVLYKRVQKLFFRKG